MQKELLYFGFKEQRLEKVLKTAKKFGIKTTEVKDEDFEQKVGFLFQLDDFKREEIEKGEIPSVEFMIFSDFDRKVLQSYLIELKENGVNIPFKSVLTETTKDWSFSYLIEHIQDEHEVVKSFNELGTLIKKAQKKLDENEDPKLREAIEYALSIREIKGVEKTDIIPRYEKLKGVFNG